MIRKKLDELPPADPAILQDMFKARQAPGTKGTDRAFAQGRGGGQDIDSMSPAARKRLLENCAAAGVSPQGKMYIGQLARKGVPCDPLALVNGLDDVHARAKAMGKYVNQEPPETPPPPSVPLAEDLIREEVGRRIEKNPDLKSVPKSTIREQVIDEHSFKRKPRT